MWSFSNDIIDGGSSGTITVVRWFGAATFVCFLPLFLCAMETVVAMENGSNVLEISSCHGNFKCPGNNIICDRETFLCVCKEGYFSTQIGQPCIEIRQLGQSCEVAEQCIKYDAHSICTFQDSFIGHPMICRCRFGYDENQSSDKRTCVKSRRGIIRGGRLHFDSMDSVPVVMGCLAAGLAIIACCAGIIQLLRKKRGGNQYGSPEAHPCPDSISLRGQEIIQNPPSNIMGIQWEAPYSLISRTPTLPTYASPGIRYTPDGIPIEDPPPSYEEAIKQSSVPLVFNPQPSGT